MSQRPARPAWWKRLTRWFRPQPEAPDDPYAMVGAPKKPRPPLRGSRAAAEPER
jgi:hypothetical protein